jgi:predicted hotdog family 3-hydroxylacyl-ACP dehydratase
MNPSDYDILELIPQRPPMQMIDRLLFADEQSAKGSLLVKESNLFCKSGMLSASALVEFIAQTAAAYTGYRNKISNNSVGEGYIGAVKNLVISSLPRVNTVITSEIVLENEIVGFTIINGKVFDQECVIAECEMRILSQQRIPDA